MIRENHSKIFSVVLLVTVLMTGCTLGAANEATPPITQVTEAPSSTAVPTIPATSTKEDPKEFDGDSAFRHLVEQVDLGPRVPQSEAHQLAGDLIIKHLVDLGWMVEEQIYQVEGIQGRNIIAKANIGKGPPVIVGAHYDTRRISDKSLEPATPVPGANDGASGVGVLLELGRVLNLKDVDSEIWLVFFDLEDQGNGAMPRLDYIEGSTYMAENMMTEPAAVVIVDMVGDKNQGMFYEGYSDPELRQSIWRTARELGYAQYFIAVVGSTIRDDHLPFRNKGIPAITIIDFDYPYWHTYEDTVDKTAPESLDRVGKTVQTWLENRNAG